MQREFAVRVKADPLPDLTHALTLSSFQSNVCVLCRQKRIVRYPCWNCQPQEAVRQAMALGSAQVPAVKISGTNDK